MNKFFGKFKIVFSNCKKRYQKSYYLLRFYIILYSAKYLGDRISNLYFQK